MILFLNAFYRIRVFGMVVLSIACSIGFGILVSHETTNRWLQSSNRNGVHQPWNSVLMGRIPRQLGSFRNSLVVGSLCLTKESSHGVCQNISNCSFAIDNFFRVQLTICAWQGHVPVVCCPGSPQVPSETQQLQHERYPRPVSILSLLDEGHADPDDNLHHDNDDDDGTEDLGQIEGDMLKPIWHLPSPPPLQSQLVKRPEDGLSPAISSSSSKLTVLQPLKPGIQTAVLSSSAVAEQQPASSDKIQPSGGVLFAGESGRPKPSQLYAVHSVNGTLLFSVRRPEKPPTSTVKVTQCGVPLYNIDRRKFRVRRFRPNSRFPEPQHSLIVGGTQAAIGSFPWMAAIFKSTRVGNRIRHNFICGGSIVAPLYIVTAAHCFHKNDDPSMFTVRVGDQDLYSAADIGTAPEDVKIQKIIQHPEYSPPQVYNDIAVLHLRRRLSLDSVRLLPICLPDDDNADFNWTSLEATVTGWGSTYMGTSRSSILHQVNLPILKNEDCDDAYGQVLGMSVYFPNGISDRLMCAGFMDGGKDACQGDSGGPLMVLDDDGRWTLQGIVSVGRGCAEPGFPGLYTRMRHYVSWVKNVTGS